MARPMTRHLASVVFVLVLGYTTLGDRPELFAQPPGKGKHYDQAFADDRDVFHFLLENRRDIRRTVKDRLDGVETLTESDKSDVTGKIQEHVAAMHRRVKDGKGIHLRDPLFAELFRHYDKITMKIEKTDKGVKVTETSTDPWVAKLIQAHARVVSQFLKNGHAEMRKNHPLPPKSDLSPDCGVWPSALVSVVRRSCPC